MRECARPIHLSRVFDDSAVIRRLAEAHSPYCPAQRHVPSNAEAEVGSRQNREFRHGASGQDTVVVSLFRGDWALDGVVLPGVRPVLEHEGLADAAARCFDAGLVRPFAVYSNLTVSLPAPQGDGHLDLPEFRGMNLSNTPRWLLTVMGASGLFEPWRVRIATAVAWFYSGGGGGFEFWPDGPDAPSQTLDPTPNSALVADNDKMHHRAMAMDCHLEDFVVGMTLESTLEHVGGDDWRIAEAGETLRALSFDEIRISVSWKARTFEDEGDERRYLEHEDDITADETWRRLRADMGARGLGPLDGEGPESIRVLGDTYVSQPTPTLTP